MGDTGEVDKKTVISVLRANGVQVYRDEACPPDCVILAKGDRVEMHDLPAIVPRRMLHYLEYHYKVPIHHFYHPEMVPPLPGETIQ